MIKIIKNNLKRLWYVFAVALFFVCFAIGGLLFGYVALPLAKFFDKEKRSEKYHAQYFIHLLFKFIVFMIEKMGLANFTFKNFERLSEDEGCIFIANHPTFLDVVAIISQVPQCENIVKASLWKNIFIARIITKAEYIPNKDPKDTFDSVKRILKNKGNLLMFPEGTRTTSGEKINVRRGAAQLAIRTGASLRLIYVSCKPEVLTKQSKWYDVPAKKPQFVLSVGEKVSSERFLQEADFPSLAARRLTQYIQQQLEEGSNLCQI